MAQNSELVLFIKKSGANEKAAKQLRDIIQQNFADWFSSKPNVKNFGGSGQFSMELSIKPERISSVKAQLYPGLFFLCNNNGWTAKAMF